MFEWDFYSNCFRGGSLYFKSMIQKKYSAGVSCGGLGTRLKKIVNAKYKKEFLKYDNVKLFK